MIRHQFDISISGTSIDGNVLFARISQRFRNTEMSQLREGVLRLTVTKRQTHPIQISIDEAKIEANDLADRLALIDNHDISSLIYRGYIDEQGQTIEEEIKRGSSASMTGHLNTPQVYYELPDKRTILDKGDNLGVLRIYRTAMSVTDNISKFLILYGLLLILNNERQKSVDEYILRQLPDILTIKGKYGDETIITRIRNSIAHPADGLDMGKLSRDVDQYIETLKKLVLTELRK